MIELFDLKTSIQTDIKKLNGLESLKYAFIWCLIILVLVLLYICIFIFLRFEDSLDLRIDSVDRTVQKIVENTKNKVKLINFLLL